MRERLRGGLPFAVLLGVTIAVFWEAIFTGKTFFSRDLFHLYYPIKLFIRESILDGRLPLWNPHIYCGMPFLGDFISSVFYPLNAIFLLLPMGWAFRLFIILHYFLASIFGYLYHRSRGGSREAAVLVGVSFGFSGYLLSVHNNLIYLQTGVWTPLFLLLAIRSRRSWGSAAGAMAVLGLQFLGGDLQGAFLSATIGGLACFLLPETEAGVAMPSRGRRAAGIGLILAGGVAIAAIQWMPALAWSDLSPRGGGLSYEEATEWSLHPVQLIEMVTPGIFGDRFDHSFWARFLVNSRFGTPWAYAVTIGVVPLFLAAGAVFSRKAGREVYFWGLVGLVSLLLALGRHVPAYRIFYEIPGFDIFRFPAKFFYLTTLSIALVSGIALDRLLGEGKSRVVAIRTGLLSVTVLVFVTFAALLIFRQAMTEFFVGETNDLGDVDKIDAMQSVSFGLLKGGFVLGMLTILFHLKAEDGLGDRLFRLILVGVTLVELTMLHAGTRITAAPDLYEATSATVTGVRSIPMEGYRFVRERGSYFAYPEAEYRFSYRDLPERKQRFFSDSLQPNLGMIYGLDDAIGYSPAEPTRLLRFMVALKDRHFTRYTLLGVRAFVAESGVESREIPLHRLRSVVTRKGTRFAVLENPSALPRARLFSKGLQVPTEEAALDALRGVDFDPNETIVLGGGTGALDFGPAERTLVTESYVPGEVSFRVTSTSGSHLLFNESWSPGWEATIDDVPTPIRRANFLMQAINVPPGSHRVIFRYRSPALYRGGLLSLIAVALAIGIAIGSGVLSLVRARRSVVSGG
ncbi:MAG: YfhO family protein [Planctomycetota bacterium]|nr:YfhO family protein [Planctomycetota bacterium]